MAQLSIHSNRINEVHELNLKTYPFLFFNGVKSAKIEYNLENQSIVDYEADNKKIEIRYKLDKPKIDHFKIIYDLSIDETIQNEYLDKRFEALERSISALLWNGIFLEVIFNNKSVYKSK